MTEAHKKIADEVGSLLAHVGDNCCDYMRNWPDLEMYTEDGAHVYFFRLDLVVMVILYETHYDL